ncbi:MAG: hypothetical protein KDJ45_05490 [Hyphomicrobiaceae bacterium]|nr:hypothetical protein [Hyphomicrobiaceae bacterium]
MWGDLFLGTTKSDNGLGGGRDADIVNGGKGDDTLFGSLDWDVLDGGVGVDKLTYEELGVRLTIDLENTENLSTFVARVIKDRLGTDNVFSIEKIVWLGSGRHCRFRRHYRQCPYVQTTY